MWLSTRAKITGVSHERDRLPCQDFAEREVGKNCTVCIVADGASSASLGEIGAAIAVESVKQYFRDAYLEKNDVSNISREIKRIFNENLRNKMKMLKFESLPLDFAATVAFVAIYENDDYFVCGIIGDCAIASFEASGNVSTVITTKNTRIPHRPDFITDEFSNFLIYNGRLSNNRGFIITTDGCANGGLLNLYKLFDNIAVNAIFDALPITQNPEVWLEKFIIMNIRKFSSDDLSMFVIYNDSRGKIKKKCLHNNLFSFMRKNKVDRFSTQVQRNSQKIKK